MDLWQSIWNHNLAQSNALVEKKWAAFYIYH